MTKEEYERCVQMAHYGRIDDPEIDLMRQALLHAHAENERLIAALKDTIAWIETFDPENQKSRMRGRSVLINARAALGVTG